MPLPRSRSECTIKVNQVKSAHVPGGSGAGGLSVSSPELRSMLVNLNTTVPQNLRPAQLSSTHRPRTRSRCQTVCHTCCPAMSPCCGIRVILVILQICLGCSITALVTYLHLFVPAVRMREKPFWAGVPLLLAGLSGIFFCVRERKSEDVSVTLFVIKTACSIFAAISIFVCVTAAVFCGINAGQLFIYDSCQFLDNGCLCFYTPDAASRTFLYTPVEDCSSFLCHLKIFLLVTGSLCAAGSLAAFSFVISIWKSRYSAITTSV
ncbi:sarcospan-like [Physella acuta]|uniref:sarcospan-like n=1 Tax=Physella acuta TaxID=109671 RepID=UPI0027DB94D7|nr:sarcospan-like [Physella acuta]